eukprot:g1154.t1
MGASCCGRCWPCGTDAALRAERQPLVVDTTGPAGGGFDGRGHGGDSKTGTTEFCLALEGKAARWAVKGAIGYGSTSSVHLCERIDNAEDTPSPANEAPDLAAGGFSINSDTVPGRTAASTTASRASSRRRRSRSRSGKNRRAPYACKVVDKRKLGVDPRTRSVMIEQLRNEVRVLKRLSHPNVIALEDVFETEERVFIITELMQGGELFDYIVSRGALSERQAANIIGQVAQGLAHCHARGVVHRDLKPENLLLAEARSGDAGESPGLAMRHGDGHTDVAFRRVKIADFGFSRMLQQNTTVSYIGTAGYLAPELRQGKPYTKAVDVWALGVITYVLLSGHLPFAPDSAPLRSDGVPLDKCTLRFPGEDWGGVSRSAKELIWSMLQPDPELRFSAVDVTRHPWVQGKTTSDRPLQSVAGLREHVKGGRFNSFFIEPHTKTANVTNVRRVKAKVKAKASAMRHSASSNNLPEIAATWNAAPQRFGSGDSSGGGSSSGSVSRSGSGSRSGSRSRSGSGSRGGSRNNSFTFLRLGSIGPGSGSDISLGSGMVSSSGNRLDTPLRPNDGDAGPGPSSCTRASVSWTDSVASVKNVLASKDRGLAAQISQDPDRRPPGATTLQPYRRCITPDRELQTCAFSTIQASRLVQPVPRTGRNDNNGGDGSCSGGIAREGVQQERLKRKRTKKNGEKKKSGAADNDDRLGATSEDYEHKAADKDIARQDTTQTVAGHPALRPPAPPEYTPAQ